MGESAAAPEVAGAAEPSTLERHHPAGAWITTANGSVSRFCWCSMPLSSVIITSNPSSAASRIRRPLRIPPQPFQTAVKASCPCSRVSYAVHEACSRQAGSSCWSRGPALGFWHRILNPPPLGFHQPLGVGGQQGLCLLQHRLRLLSLDAGELLDEVVQPVAGRQIIEKGLHRHPRPREAGDAVHDLGIGFDGAHESDYTTGAELLARRQSSYEAARGREGLVWRCAGNCRKINA